jgi:transposase
MDLQNVVLSFIHHSYSANYRVSEKRGDVSIISSGVVTHDHFVSYYSKLDGVQHSLCNAHHLRELKAVVEIDKEPWAKSMIRLLLFGHVKVQQDPQNITDDWLSRFRKIYDNIIASGLLLHENLGLLSKPKRGRVKRRPGHNLLLRLKNRSDDTLRFLYNLDVPFTNNAAEQSLRMIKVKQKVSGCFRTTDGAKDFLTVRSYTATAKKMM